MDTYGQHGDGAVNVVVVWLDGKLAALAPVHSISLPHPRAMRFSLDAMAQEVAPTPRQDREAHEALWHLREAATRGKAR